MSSTSFVLVNLPQVMYTAAYAICGVETLAGLETIRRVSSVDVSCQRLDLPFGQRTGSPARGTMRSGASASRVRRSFVVKAPSLSS